MQQQPPKNILVAIGSIATFFGTKMGKFNIHRLCSTLGYDTAGLGDLNKTQIISRILRESYQQDRTAFESFIVALVNIHDLGQQGLAQLNSHLRELGYEMRSGALQRISPMRIRWSSFKIYLLPLVTRQERWLRATLSCMPLKMP